MSIDPVICNHFGNENADALDIAPLIDHFEAHETDALGPYRVPEMELTLFWNILEI